MNDLIVHRHYRLAAADTFVDMSSKGTATMGSHRAEAAERDLRARLAEGERPKAVLIAPERACVSQVGPDGNLESPVYAWHGNDHHELSSVWLHAPHVLGTIQSYGVLRDRVSRFYADRGSVRVPAGRLTHLKVSSWVAPVADQLAERYGVTVEVLPGPDIPAPDVPIDHAIHIPGLLTTEQCQGLRDYFVDNVTDSSDGVVPGRVELERGYVMPPPEVVTVTGTLLNAVGQTWDLEATEWQTAIVGYTEGDGFPEHTDADELLASTLDRTVSFTLLLSEPGVDFEGGEIVVNGEVVPIRQGDLVGFTARTPHEVRPITRGHRLVLLGFGEVIR